jgi:hypothetical protein
MLFAPRLQEQISNWVYSSQAYCVLKAVENSFLLFLHPNVMCTNLISTGEKMTAYEIHALLMAECIRQELPKYYKDDVIVHDLNILLINGTKRFVWMIRESGSHLVPLDPVDRNYARAILKTYQGYTDAKWYVFDNGALASITYDGAKNLIEGA